MRTFRPHFDTQGTSARDRASITVSLAVGTTVVSSLPVFLIAALFINIDRDVSAPLWALGAVVGSYWVAASIASTTAGKAAALIGTRKLNVVSIAAAVVALVGSAVCVPEWHWLFVWITIGGVSTGFGHPASNHLIQLWVPENRRALAYGLKQAAVPFATVVAGIAVPAVAITVGWRYAFGAAAVLAMLLLVAYLTRAPRSNGLVTRRSTRMVLGRTLRRRLLLLSCVTALAAGASTATVAFAVTAAVERSIDLGLAGALLSVGSLLGATTRVVVGAFGTRWRGGALGTVAALQGLGAVGLIIMGATDGASYVVGFLIAVAFGWGWPGLMHFVVSAMSGPAAPAATGMVSTGTYLGNAVAPFLVGLLYEYAGSSATWFAVGSAMAVASMLAWIASRLEEAPIAEELTK